MATFRLVFPRRIFLPNPPLPPSHTIAASTLAISHQLVVSLVFFCLVVLSNVARAQILSDYKNEVLLFLHFFAIYPSSCGGHATEQWYGLEGKKEVVLPGDFLCTFFCKLFLTGESSANLLLVGWS